MAGDESGCGGQCLAGASGLLFRRGGPRATQAPAMPPPLPLQGGQPASSSRSKGSAAGGDRAVAVDPTSSMPASLGGAVRPRLQNFTKALTSELSAASMRSLDVEGFSPRSGSPRSPVEFLKRRRRRSVRQAIRSPGEAALAFLEEGDEQETPRDAVHGLLAVLGRAGLAGHFYSVPGGWGRQGDRTGLQWVASSPREAEAGHALLQELELDLTDTARSPSAVLLRPEAAAFALHTLGRAEGLLVVAKSNLVNGDDTAAMWSGGLEITVELLGHSLEERITRMRWKQESEASGAALRNVQRTVQHYVGAHAQGENDMATSSLNTTMKVASNMVTQELLRGRVRADIAALWCYDAKTNDVVMNNNGTLDGPRMPAGDSLVDELLRCGSRAIVFVEDAQNDARCATPVDDQSGAEPQSTICVPLQKPAKVRVQPCTGFEARCACNVLQLNYSRRNGQCNIDHFDRVGAEELQRSVLPSVLHLRDHFMQVLRADLQRISLQNLVADLSKAGSVLEVKQMVERQFPEIMRCERCTLWFVDEANGDMWTSATDYLPVGARMGVGEGLVGHVAQMARDRTSGDTSPEGSSGVLTTNEPHFCALWAGDLDADQFVTRNLMTAPVFSCGTHKRLVGVIQVLNKTGSLEEAAAVGNQQAPKFSEVDAQHLRRLSEAIGDHMQRFILDMMLASARMQEEADLGTRPSHLNAYTGLERSVSNRSYNHRTTSIIDEFYEHVSLMIPDRTEAAAVQWRKPDTSLLDDCLQDMSPTKGVDVCEPRIDYWSLETQDEISLVVQCLRCSDVFSELAVCKSTLYAFVTAVKSAYRGVAYHNFQHALATTHYVFKILRESGIQNNLDRRDLFALIIAALCHDVDHRGRNNAFEVITQSELALRYNDSSPLENHHCARSFEIALRNKGCNVFDQLSKDAFRQVRKSMVAGILATDMKHHGDAVQQVQAFRLQPGIVASQSPFLVELVIHAADISNPIMPSDISAHFASLIGQEFVDQAEEEFALGIPVTEFMDGYRTAHIAAKSQVNFMDFVCKPLFDRMFQVFPGLEGEKQRLHLNRQLTADLRDRLEAEFNSEVTEEPDEQDEDA
eukprot:TRINITY_DN57140_c0_g1_i1.p1 TRINITY_DN57140_c0_g1~~TRINITY_DN57140_c0_g1_i1.p1  ORF type:complete len:1116 (+),score=259.22 TRINITY_DN57140_c0_g1_i1:86-3349(+)